jgi:hypothetical protein
MSSIKFPSTHPRRSFSGGLSWSVSCVSGSIDVSARGLGDHDGASFRPATPRGPDLRTDIRFPAGSAGAGSKMNQWLCLVVLAARMGLAQPVGDERVMPQVPLDLIIRDGGGAELMPSVAIYH